MKKLKKQSASDVDNLNKVHSEALKHYEASFAAERGQRDECLEDMRFVFVEGAQWDDIDKNSRKDRPRFEINKVAVPVNQAIGEQRQNRISIKVRPAKGAASTDMADVLSGLIRNIESESHFKEVKDNAFKEIVSGGIGAWCLSAGFEDDSFDQTIQIKTIRSAASSVFYDPSSTEELKQDAKWIIVTEDVDRAYFRKRYPDATVSDLSSNTNSGYLSEWQTRDTVRIADYWVKEPCIKELALMTNGDIIELNEKTQKVIDELALQGNFIVKTRKKHSYKVVHYKINASGILDGPNEWAGSMIPVVPIFGYNVWINGQHYYRGMVRMAKDPQRVYNYATSQAIEVSALTPKDPYWVTPKQMEGLEGQMRTFNVNNNPFMFYNEDPLNPGPPKRGGAPSVQAALIQQVQQADMDVQATTGLYAPSLGEAQTDQRSRAILALQKQGNTSTHELVDNLAKAVEYTGQLLIDLIPKLYDTERQVSILGEDGSTQDIVLNQKVVDRQTGETVLINDVALGKYEVISSAGPSYATKRIETLNLLTKLAEANPAFATVSSDLIAQSVDFEQSAELTKRIRKQMLSQGIVDPTDEEIAEMESNQPQQPSAVDQINFKMLQLQLEQQAALVDNLEMQNKKIQADYEFKKAQTQVELTDVIKTKTIINKNLDDQGIAANMPIEAGELSARRKNMQLLNDNLEISLADVEKMEELSLPIVELPPEVLPPEHFQNEDGVLKS